MKGSVLDELTDAFRRARRREPKPEELLAFDLPFDEKVYHGYRDAFRALDEAYDSVLRRRDAPPLQQLDASVDAYWQWLRTLKDAMSLFRILRWWRQDHEGIRTTATSSATEDVAYVLAVLRLFTVAVQTYDANMLARDFGPLEWAFVRTPLAAASRYHACYDRIFDGAFRDPAGVVKRAQGFLRLHAAGRREGAWLATDDELRVVVTGLLKSDPAELYARSFVSAGPNRRARQSVFKVGQTVGNDVYIVYFEGARPTDVFVNFAKTGGALYTVNRGKFVEFADQAEYELIYELTKEVLVLLPLLFDVLMAVPGVALGGFPGLVEACLQPVEAKAAEKVMEAMGLDPDKAGWVVLGINILAHRLRPAKMEVEAPETGDGDWWWGRWNGSRGVENPEVDSNVATVPRVDATTELGSPATDTDARAVQAKPARPLRQDTDPNVLAEQRALPVKADEEPKALGKAGSEQEGDEAHKAGTPTDDARGTGRGSRGVPASPTPDIAPPRVRSALARVESDLERERLRVAEVKRTMSSEAWAEARASETTELYNLLERRAVLRRMVQFPRRQYLEQVKVLGVRVSKKLVKATEAISSTGKGRRVDILELDGSAATFHDLKTPSTLGKSVAGGMSEIDFDAEFRPSSEIGRQHQIEQEVIAYARRTGGKIVVSGKDPVNGATITKELDPDAIESTVGDYTDLGSD